jgi:hypothetical protein
MAQWAGGGGAQARAHLQVGFLRLEAFLSLSVSAFLRTLFRITLQFSPNVGVRKTRTLTNINTNTNIFRRLTRRILILTKLSWVSYCLQRLVRQRSFLLYSIQQEQCFVFRAIVFLPLLYVSIVILPLLFRVCDFAPAFLKRSNRLPLVWTVVWWARDFRIKRRKKMLL